MSTGITMSDWGAGEIQPWQEQREEERGGGGQAEGRLFGVDISAVVVKGREWRLFSVHFIPFLMVPF